MTGAGWLGVRRARRAAQWGKKKYAGSLAEDVWRRLDAMDFINRGMVFAATLLLCLFPFLIVVSALAGRPAVQSLTRYTGLNSQAAADIGHLFASPTVTASAVAGTASMVFFVFGGIAAAAALQEIYEQAFDMPHRRIKDLPHRLAWLAVLIGASLLSGWAGPGLRHAGGPVLLAVAGLVWATGFWWLTMRILLAGRISWRALFPAACATGVLYVAMQTVFSLVFSAMVISDEHTYGPIGTIFALLSYLIAIGVVVILGVVAGRAWHERSPGMSQTGQLHPACRIAHTARTLCHSGWACLAAHSEQDGVTQRPWAWNGSWNGSVDSPSAACAVSAIFRGIGAASASTARDRASRNA